MHLRLVFRAPNFKSSKNFVKVVQHSALSYSLTWINPARAKIDRNFILADLTWNRRAELTNCGYLEKSCYLYTRTPNEICTEISFWLVINSSTVLRLPTCPTSLMNPNTVCLLVLYIFFVLVIIIHLINE